MTSPEVDETLERIAAEEWDELRRLLHPYLHWRTAEGLTIRGRNNVLAHLASTGVPAAPLSIELRDGQIYRWA